MLMTGRTPNFSKLQPVPVGGPVGIATQNQAHK
jgi:hypothetical protein